MLEAKDDMKFVLTEPLLALVIRVVPDETAPVPEPQVLISNRDLQVPLIPAHIYWRKLPASKKFKFISLTEDNNPKVFKSIEVHKKYIKAVFDPPQGSDEYKYTLTIKYKGELYTTDERIGPIGDRPVIRN
jgi:hypothetical protein